MDLSISKVTNSQQAYAWGGGGAMLGALLLYYFKGDNTLFTWISWILGGVGLIALCC